MSMFDQDMLMMEMDASAICIKQSVTCATGNFKTANKERIDRVGRKIKHICDKLEP